MADTSVKLSGTYDSIEAYNILEEMRNMSSDYEEIRTEAAAAASAATAAVTTAQTAANSASTYAGNAQTYAGNANTSAGEAAGYASDASTAANNAASSETNAHNSEVAAAASATSAAASEAVVAGALPLSGGTMSGVIVFSNSTAVKRDVDNADTVIEGASAYNRGAYLQLYGKDSALHSGEFALVAHNGTNNPTFAGSPNGTLKWDGKEIERVNASGTNYIRYESGLQLCWGAVTVTPSGGSSPFNHSGNATVTFPVAFSSAPMVFANINDNAGYWNAECQTQSTTGATISVGGYNTNQHNAQYLAVGRWK